MKLSQSQLQAMLSNSHLDHKGKNLYADCPFCGEHEFGISLDDNHLYNCFRKKQCGQSGNIYTLLSHLGRAKEFVDNRNIDIFSPLTHLNVFPIDRDKIELVTLPEISPPLLWNRVFEDSYLRLRGFVDYQFEKFEVGRSKLYEDYIFFLIRDCGRLVGYVGRSDKSKQEIDEINQIKKFYDHKLHPRYKNSTTDFTKTLFGYDELIQDITTSVILVEGIFSKTKTDTNLQLDDQWELKCCATLGAKLSQYQILLLKKKGVKRLIFWFEADVLKKIKSIVAQASVDFEVLVGYLPDKDPNDLTQEQSLDLLDRSEEWLQFNMNYI